MVAQVVATANVSDGKAEAPLQQRDDVAGKTWRDGMTVGAVTVQINGRAAVYGCVFVSNQAQGYQAAITRGDLQAFADVFLGVIAPRNFLYLQ